jgi:1-acyl-sn-glycerol-3-phosphate acyltransferase
MSLPQRLLDKVHQFSLLKERRFLPFFFTQFLGAFNDNVYKNALVIMLAFSATGLSAADSHGLVNLAGGLFILPFFLFSATAGQLADKYEKSRIIRYVKLFEIGIMLCAAAGFYWQSLTLLIGSLFLLGTQAALFGPVKYAILPQQLKEEELIGGNALVESGTFLAILLGTLLGGVLIGLEHGRAFVSVAVLALAVLGYASSRFIPVAPAPSPKLKINWNPLTETWRNLRFTRRNHTVFLAILGISWFWFFGATLLSQFPSFSKEVLGGNEQVVTLLLTVFSVGIALGSLLCERMSGSKVEIGLVPFGSIGLTLFALDVYFATRGLSAAGTSGVIAFLAQARNWRVLVDLSLLGLFGGFYIVPLYALIQSRSSAAHRSRIIAGNNILNALFMVLSAALSIALLRAGLTIPELILVVGLLNAGVAVYIYMLVPEFLMRFLVWVLVHSVYRLEEEGLQHIPEEGPALLVCNHVSYVDAFVIAAACRRPIRFVMDHSIFRIPGLNFVFRTAGTIPIAPAKEDPALLYRAYEEIATALEDGALVCIFPEGRLTDTGEMGPFKPGVVRIVKRSPVPVVPLALRGLWGSPFSRDGEPVLAKLNRQPSLKIGLVASTPVAPTQLDLEALRATVLALRGERR